MECAAFAFIKVISLLSAPRQGIISSNQESGGLQLLRHLHRRGREVLPEVWETYCKFAAAIDCCAHASYSSTRCGPCRGNHSAAAHRGPDSDCFVRSVRKRTSHGSPRRSASPPQPLRFPSFYS